MNVNQRTIDLIKQFEGFVPDAYRDAVGVWTIGWGTTKAAGVGIEPKPGMTITKDEAEVYLRRAVEKFAHQIEQGFTRQPNENQFGAFVSLAYNIGPGAFLKSTALKRWNAGDLAGVEDGFRMFVKAGGKTLNGLVRRREAEIDLFRAPVSKTPGAILVNPGPALEPLVGHKGWLATVLAALANFITALIGKRK